MNLWLQAKATTAATHCPTTVATAAPVAPSLGKPSSPKIMIGSRMIFVMAPQSCEVMLKIVLPVEVSTLSKKISAKIPNEKIITVLR